MWNFEDEAYIVLQTSEYWWCYKHGSSSKESRKHQVEKQNWREEAMMMSSWVPDAGHGAIGFGGCLAFWPDLSLLSSCYCLLEWQCLLCIIICWKYVNPLLQCYYYYCCCFVLQSLVVKILPSSFEETLDFWTMLKMWRLCEPLKSDWMCFALWDGPEPRKARDECYSLSANASPWAHVLKSWSHAGGAVLGERGTFKR